MLHLAKAGTLVAAAVPPVVATAMSIEITATTIAGFVVVGAIGLVQWFLLREVSKIDALKAKVEAMELAAVEHRERLAALDRRLNDHSASHVARKE